MRLSAGKFSVSGSSGEWASPTLRHAIAEHQSVLDAFSSGDPEKAALAMAEHVQKVRGRAIADAPAADLACDTT